MPGKCRRLPTRGAAATKGSASAAQASRPPTAAAKTAHVGYEGGESEGQTAAPTGDDKMRAPAEDQVRG